MNTPPTFLTTRELAELLRIKERKVYDLAAAGDIPCTKVMGKLLFPHAAVEAWLAAGQRGVPEPHRPEPSRPNVLLGSHDPLLEWTLRESQSGLAAYFDGSTDGLERFSAGEGIAAGLHLFDPATEGWNTAQVAAAFAAKPVVLVEWARRRRGLIMRPDDQSRISAFSDLRGLRVAARQANAGAQQLFDHLLRTAGIPESDITWSIVARSETDAALAVLDQSADVSFGLQSLAEQYRLGFVSIIEERYDLMVDRRSWFEPPIQALLTFCRSTPFAEHAAAFAGYDVSGLGRVHFNGTG